MNRLSARIGLRLIGAAALLVTVLFASAAPSTAASYTLNFTGKVTSATDVFSALGFTAGDAVSGSITFDPVNDSAGLYLPNQSSFSQSASTFTFHVSHPGVTDFTHTEHGGGTIDSELLTRSTIRFLGVSALASLPLTLQTDGSTPALTSLVGLPTTTGGILAMLGGNVLRADGRYIFDGLGAILFDLDYTLAPAVVAATPIPAALPLFGAGLAALGFAARRRRRAV